MIKIINSINKLPSELIDIIMNYYWMDVYKNTINTIDSTIYDFNKMKDFIIKFIINDSERVYTNYHLHYYYEKYNKKLNEIIKDKGKLLLLKKITMLKIDFNNLEKISVYNQIDSKIRLFAILSISMSNIQRNVLYSNFTKFNL